MNVLPGIFVVAALSLPISSRSLAFTSLGVWPLPLFFHLLSAASNAWPRHLWKNKQKSALCYFKVLHRIGKNKKHNETIRQLSDFKLKQKLVLVWKLSVYFVVHINTMFCMWNEVILKKKVSENLKKILQLISVVTTNIIDNMFYKNGAWFCTIFSWLTQWIKPKLPQVCYSCILMFDHTKLEYCMQLLVSSPPILYNTFITLVILLFDGAGSSMKYKTQEKSWQVKAMKDLGKKSAEYGNKIFVTYTVTI